MRKPGACSIVLFACGLAALAAASPARAQVSFDLSDGTRCTATPSSVGPRVRCADPSPSDLACVHGPIADLTPAAGAEQVWVCSTCPPGTDPGADGADCYATRSAIVVTGAGGAIVSAGTPFRGPEGEQWLGTSIGRVAVLDLVGGSPVELVVELAGNTVDNVCTDTWLAVLAWRGAGFERVFATPMLQCCEGACTRTDLSLGVDGAHQDVLIVTTSADPRARGRRRVSRWRWDVAAFRYAADRAASDARGR